MIELTTNSEGTLASASVLAAVAIHSIESGGKYFACHSGIPDETGTALFDWWVYHFDTLPKNRRPIKWTFRNYMYILIIHLFHSLKLKNLKIIFLSKTVLSEKVNAWSEKIKYMLFYTSSNKKGEETKKTNERNEIFSETKRNKTKHF
jgi:hypothetical protein